MGYYDNYLEHKLGGWTRKNHKYISRERGKNGKWKYTYANSKGRSSSSSKGNSVLNLLKRFGEDTVDKIGDTFDKDYDHVLDLFDKDVKSNLIQKINRTGNGLMTSVVYDKYNRQFERKLQRGEYDAKDWKFVNDKDEKAQSERKREDQRKQEEKQQKKAEKTTKFFQGNHFQNLPRQKNPSGKTYGYYKKISTGNGKWRYFYSESEYSRYMKRTNTLDKDYQFMQDVPVLAHKDSAENAAKVADVGTDLGNCSSCSVAFELRMRGYDVKARDDIDGKTTEEICDMFDADYSVKNNWYVDTSREENSNYVYTTEKGLFVNKTRLTTEDEKLQIAQDDLERSIKERGGDNQRGLMFINWTQSDPDENGQRHRSGSGHVFNYVVTDGEVKFYDAQKGETNNQTGGEIDIKEYLDNTDVLHHRSYRGDDEEGWVTYNSFVRIDNKPLTESGKENIQYEPVEVHDTPRTKEDLDKR